MSLLVPIALGLGFLALPIIALYMMRLRRRELPISSTFLWRKLALDRTANAPWQKLRANLLLLLQLLILAALVLSLARLALLTPGRIGGDLVVLVDASASMLATDGNGGATRFEEAIAEAAGLIDQLSGDERMTLIQAGPRPAVLAAATADKKQLRDALETASAELSAADWQATIALASGSARSMSDPRFVLISDGGLPERLPDLPGNVTFLPVGSSGENVSISALDVSEAEDGKELFAGISNQGSSTARVFVSLTVDGMLQDSQSLEVASGKQATTTWLLPSTAGVVEVRVEPGEGTLDYMAQDDRAWAVLDDVNSRQVLLASEGNLFLERILSILPGYEVTHRPQGPNGMESGEEPFGITIYDGVALPEQLPPGAILIFDPRPRPPNPEAENSVRPIQATGVFTNTSVTRISSDELLTDVDWSSVSVSEAQHVVSEGLIPLIEAEGGPLLLAGEIDGRRVALFTFDLHDSDLPLQVAFPVLMSNILGWLAPTTFDATAAHQLQPGDSVTVLPDGRASEFVVEYPDGSTRKAPVTGASDPLTFNDTYQPGPYAITLIDEDGNTRSMGGFAVNFFDAAESNIQPGDASALNVEGDGQELSGPAGYRDLWPWLLGAALLLLMVEWWAMYRRPARRAKVRPIR